MLKCVSRFSLFVFRFLATVVFLLTLSFVASAQSFTVTEYRSNPASHVINVDLNGDGRKDLVTADEFNNTVSVLMGNANGSFQTPLQYAVGQGPVAVASGDFNKDGKPDLVTADFAGSTFSLLINAGDGSFLPATKTSLSGQPLDIAVGDFNRDGNADVVVGWTTVPDRSNVIKIYLGIGSGKFIGPVITQGFNPTPEPGATKTYMTGFASGDFNNDGLPDLAIIECCGGFDVEMGDLIVLISRGDGTFDRRMVSQFSVPQDVTVYDLDKDGYADILTTFAGCHTPCAGLAYFHNTRNDSFTQFGTSVDESAYSTLRSPVAADFDADGITDVGVLARAHDQYSSYYNHDSLLIFKGTEPGAISSTYRDFRVTSDSSTLWAASIGDWNKDSKTDVAVASRERGSVYTLLNAGAGGPNCAISTVQPSVTVCTPAENATVTSPFRLVAKTNPSAYPTTYMRVYANGKAIYEAAVSSLDTQLSLASGLYRLRVVAWNSNGQSYYQDRYITVSGTTTGTCTLNYAQPSVTICEPTEGATVPNPVHLVAKTNPNQYPTTFMRVYANSQPVYESAAASIDTNLNLGAGTWRIRVVAWNSAGQV
ncbi:MAG TPA: VCBS repeat-containing protein, partial [Terriglobales bacterium]|nr:VCBS repeat-containing protein [Terriglobales bacterium]